MDKEKSVKIEMEESGTAEKTHFPLKAFRLLFPIVFSVLCIVIIWLTLINIMSNVPNANTITTTPGK